MAFGPDSETYLNPLDLSDVSELLETTQLAYKIEAVLALSAASMAEGNEGLSDVERSIISRCVEKAYLTCGKSGAVPQLQDLYDILRQQPEPEAEIVALRFERYVSGALSIFNHPVSYTHLFDGPSFRAAKAEENRAAVRRILDGVR